MGCLKVNKGDSKRIPIYFPFKNYVILAFPFRKLSVKLPTPNSLGTFLFCTKLKVINQDNWFNFPFFLPSKWSFLLSHISWNMITIVFFCMINDFQFFLCGIIYRNNFPRFPLKLIAETVPQNIWSIHFRSITLN